MDARQLQALYANLPVGVLVVGPSGEAREVNRRVEQMLGLRAGDVPFSDGMWTVLRPDGTPMPAHEVPIARVLAGEAVVRDVELGIRWDTETQWLRVTAAAMPALDGGGAVVVMEDITALHEAEARRRGWQTLLAATREHLAMACDAAELTLWRYDHGKRTTQVVRGGGVYLQAGLDLAGGTFQPADVVDLIVPSQREEYVTVRERAREVGDPYEVTMCLTSGDGRHLWLLERGQPDPDDPDIILGGTLDVTAQVEEQQRRQLAEDRLAMVLRTAPDIISVADADGVVQYVSPAVLDVLGEPPEALVGQPVKGLVATGAVAAGDRSSTTVVERMRVERADGTPLWLETTTRRPQTEDGRGQLVSVSRDVTAEVETVTELERLRSEAERSTRAKSSFLANISHEIRTPMNAIMGMTRLVLETELDPRQERYVEHVEQAAESLLVIINDLLDFSKFEAGKLQLEDIEFRLDEVLDGFRATIGLAALGHGVELLFDVDVDVPSALQGDPLRLGQILSNLGSNAVKFTEHGGEVVLDVSVAAQTTTSVELLFRVADTGIGLGPHQLEHLFEPFTQADAGTTRAYGGTGLGLAIVHQLVDYMGGSISVSSDLGVGTAFEVVLPFRLSEQPVERYRDPRLAADKPRTLVVDDRPTAREVHARMLTGLGLRVDEARDATEALELVEAAVAAEDPYELLVVDWKMPGMDGIALTRAVDEQQAPTPTVLMVTAHERTEARSAATGVDIRDFLVKPTTPSMLHDAILHALGHDVFRRARQRDLVADVEALAAPVRGASVLVVEDNEVNQELAVELLEKHGVRVTVADDGRAALAILSERAFDAVLMDCQMPTMDGYEATRRLRQRPELADVPVIAMTANAMAEDRERVLEAGMDDHLAKPIDVQELWSKLARWTAGRATSDADGAVATDASRPATASAIELDGVDVDEALRICGGDASFYRRLLAIMVRDQADAADRVRAALAAGDHEGASMAAHALRGVAANIRAKELSAVAGELEEACDTGDASAAAVILERVETMVDRLVAQVQALDEIPGDAADERDQTASLSTLRGLVDACDPEATRLAERLVVGDSPRAEHHMQAFVDALRRYDFDEAGRHLGHLEQVLTD